ncbi:hypothetical protein Tco_0169454 [Tanacetum coccineum]
MGTACLKGWVEKVKLHPCVPTAAIRIPIKKTEVRQRRHHQGGTSSQRTSKYSGSEYSESDYWESKSKSHRSDNYEDDLSQPWTCEERNPFTLRIRHFNFTRTRMPSHVKTYDGSGDPEDHLKLL